MTGLIRRYGLPVGLGIIVLAGAASAVLILVRGHTLLGSSDVVPWNVFVVNYAYLAGTATGLAMISSLGPVFGLRQYDHLARMGFFVSILTMLGAFASILLDLGRPWMGLGFLLSPNLSSPIWWMSMLYGVFLVSILGTLGALILEQENLARVGGIATLTLSLAASGNLGLVFGSVYARDLWYGPFTPFTFVMVAWILGTAVLFLLHRMHATGTDQHYVNRSVKELRYVLTGLLVMRLVYVITKIMMGVYVGKGDIMILIRGSFTANFWIGEVLVGLLIPLAVLWVVANGRPGIAAADQIVSISVLIGFYMARYNLVIAGQMYPVLDGTPKGSYGVTVAEVLVIAGTVAFVALGLLLARGTFLVEHSHSGSSVPAND